jgi:hypothetical protein
MGNAKKRTVRFYRASLLDGQGNSKLVANDFWPNFIDHVGAVDRVDRESARNGRKLLGVAGDSVKYATKYLYIGRMRAKGDYPDDFDQKGTQANSLAFNPSINEIAEPCYIVPTGHNRTIAVLRTSGGPRIEDIETYISDVGGFSAQQESFALNPVVSQEQWNLLAASELVSKLDVRVDGHAAPTVGTAGKVGEAVRKALDLADNDATLNMQLSFGHGVPDTVAGHNFSDEAKKFLQSGQYGKAVATLKIPNGTGGWRTESVDFIRELVTYQAKVGQTDSDPLTPDLVLPEILNAIDESKNFLK